MNPSRTKAFVSIVSLLGSALSFLTTFLGGVQFAHGEEAADIAITEIMYNPASGDKREQFIEIFNRSESETHELRNYRFTSGVGFTFPDVSIGPGQYLVVCADEGVLRRLHGITNTVGSWDPTTTLRKGGERIRLVSGANPPVEVEDFTYDDRTPWPVLSDGYGHSLERRNPSYDNDKPANWAASRVGTGWTHAVVSGIATSSTLCFYLSGPGVAYVDDVKLYPTGNTGDDRVDNGSFEDVALSPWQAAGNHAGSSSSSLEAFGGRKSLRLVSTGSGEGVSKGISQTDLGLTLGMQCTLEFQYLLTESGQCLVARLTDPSSETQLYVEARGAGATPGRENSVHGTDLPPFIYSGTHTPSTPDPATNVTLLARVFDDQEIESVEVHWDSGGGEQVSILFDDGQHGDGAAHDGDYGASIGGFPVESIVRYWFTCRDDAGQEGRYPFQGNPTQRLGFYVEPEGIQAGFTLRSSTGLVSNNPPVYHLILDPDDLTGDPPHLNGNPITYRPATFIYNGEVFDNVRVRHSGQTSLEAPKRKWKLNFNKDHRFLTPFEGHVEVDDFNLESSYTDKTFLREWLASRAFLEAGEPALEMWHVRLYLNGAYHGLYLHEEEGNGTRWLSANGLDPDGWLWKAYGDARGDVNYFDLKVDEENNPKAAQFTLAGFLSQANELTGQGLVDFLRANMDVRSFVNYLAVVQLIQDCDSVHNNYYVYADKDAPAGTWRFLPWDKDLTHGRNFECWAVSDDQPGIYFGGGSSLYNDTIRYDMFGDPDLLFGSSARPRCSKHWNGVVNAFINKTEAFRLEYIARLGELLNSSYHPSTLIPLIDEMAADLADEVAIDWNRNEPYGIRASYGFHVDMLKAFVVKRYEYLSNALDTLGSADLDRLVCSNSGAYAELTWRNRATYDEIRVYRNATLVATLAGGETSTSVGLGGGPSPDSFRVAALVLGMELTGASCSIARDAAEPVVAAFRPFLRSGRAPLSVAFENQSTGAQSFVWDFGDGETSQEPSPSHVYTKVSCYRVTLQAFGPGGSDFKEDPDCIAVLDDLHAEFGAIPTEGKAPLSVSFVNQSTGGRSYHWDFGDGETISGANPKHEYKFGGQYTVTLRAVAQDGTESTVERPRYIQVDGDLDAEFHADPLYGAPPLSLEFTDESSGMINGWFWDFGDGQTSREQNPEHTYVRTGAYTVKLEVFGFTASNVEAKTAYVCVGPGTVFERGDANADGRRDISDAVRILMYLFGGDATLDCRDAADVDDSGTLDISDPIRILSYLYLGGQAMAPPFPGMGPDPTEDELDCVRWGD